MKLRKIQLVQLTASFGLWHHKLGSNSTSLGGNGLERDTESYKKVGNLYYHFPKRQQV